MGRAHDFFNLVFGAGATAFLGIYGLGFEILFWFSLGWLFSTFVFGPDNDLGAKKRLPQILRILLNPYRLFSKHRGISHQFILGTLSRITYLILMLWGLWAIGVWQGWFEGEILGFGKGIYWMAQNYNYHQPGFFALTWIFLGLIYGDFMHLVLDLFSSGLKKIF